MNAPATTVAAGSLRLMLQGGEFIVAPGVFDMFSAKVADRMGFKALYMTGYGVSASHLGLPDAGLVGYTDMVSRAATIAQGITRPLIADADTGFGGLINIRHTVRGYEAAGVQADVALAQDLRDVDGVADGAAAAEAGVAGVPEDP